MGRVGCWVSCGVFLLFFMAGCKDDRYDCGCCDHNDGSGCGGYAGGAAA